jgi:inosine-uridine nucleoside N-ribohydrolase
VHGDNGLGGIQLAEPDQPYDPRHAVDFLADTIAGRVSGTGSGAASGPGSGVVSGARAGAGSGSAEPVTLVATGPLTNVALLFARYPEVAAKLGRLVIMGGSIGAGNKTPAAEFNIWFDPEAAYRTLTDPGLPTPVPVTMIGLDITYRTVLESGHLDAMRAAGRTGALVADALGHYRHGYARLLGRPVVPVHDAVAVTAAIRPDLIVTRPARIEVDTGCGPSRGRTAVDLNPRPGTVGSVAAQPVTAQPVTGQPVTGQPVTAHAEVAVDADVAGVVAFILDRVMRLSVPD